jgi:hypothetical protein
MSSGLMMELAIPEVIVRRKHVAGQSAVGEDGSLYRGPLAIANAEAEHSGTLCDCAFRIQ